MTRNVLCNANVWRLDLVGSDVSKGCGAPRRMLMIGSSRACGSSSTSWRNVRDNTSARCMRVDHAARRFAWAHQPAILHRCKNDPRINPCSRFRAFSTTVCSPASTEAVSASTQPTPNRSSRPVYAVVLSSIVLCGALIDKGRRRSLLFWSTAFPVYLHYRTLDLLYNYADGGARSSSGDQKSVASGRMNMIEDDSSKASLDLQLRSLLKSNILYPLFGERQEIFQRLHNFYSPTVRDLCMRLRGLYLKNAQFLSLREDVVPEPYLSWCRRLQHEAPTTLDKEEARAIVEREVGLGYFTSLDLDKPIGSAAIGMVYRGTITRQHTDANGAGEGAPVVLPVAVKVQVPGTEEQFRCDMATMRSFCHVAYPSFVPQLAELEAMFLTEFDYRREARNIKQVRDNWLRRGDGGAGGAGGSSEERETTTTSVGFMKRWLWNALVVAPVKALKTIVVLSRAALTSRIRNTSEDDELLVRDLQKLFTIDALGRAGAGRVGEVANDLPDNDKRTRSSTKPALSKQDFRSLITIPDVHHASQNVLVMDLVAGKNFVSGLEELTETIAKQQGKTTEQMRAELKTRLKKDGYETLEEAKVRFWLAQKKFGKATTSKSGQEEMLINPAVVVELLLHFFCHQVLIDGALQADPHPGNYMVSTPNSSTTPTTASASETSSTGSPRLGCIDFGQLKVVPLEKRLAFARLILALAEDTEEGDAEANRIAVSELGARSEKMSDPLRLEVLRFWISEDHPDLLSGKENLDSLVRRWHNEDPRGTIDNDIITVNRAAFMIRSLCLELGFRVKLLEFWVPYAKQLLRSQRGREHVSNTVKERSS
ncbi:unnamed protein product [Amoebophrya sp. A25]|nr:unnamed protein product [Amoebophrya sp. A25]|eukprot:GSA25T00020598001.1